MTIRNIINHGTLESKLENSAQNLTTEKWVSTFKESIPL
jgi:hypothetical protein